MFIVDYLQCHEKLITVLHFMNIIFYYCVMEKIMEQELEKSILYNRLDELQQLSIQACKLFLKKIWAREPLIRHYTDHGLNHSLRILKIIEQIPYIKNDFLTQDESYALLLGIFLHDIGMQCDIRKHEIVKMTAENKYNAVFNEKYKQDSDSLSANQQEDIRTNHHLLTAAWLEVTACDRGFSSRLQSVVQTIPDTIMSDVIDICKYHSKLDINECENHFKHLNNQRKKLVAALLRLGDELDINYDRVDMVVVREFASKGENSVFWYLHNNTIVKIKDDFNIEVYFRVYPKDTEKYSDYLKEEIIKLKEKNKNLLYTLINNGIPIQFENTDIKEDIYAERLETGVFNIFIKKSKISKEKLNTFKEIVASAKDNKFILAGSIGKEDESKDIINNEDIVSRHIPKLRENLKNIENSLPKLTILEDNLDQYKEVKEVLQDIKDLFIDKKDIFNDSQGDNVSENLIKDIDKCFEKLNELDIDTEGD
jgi:hypothetical protein